MTKKKDIDVRGRGGWGVTPDGVVWELRRTYTSKEIIQEWVPIGTGRYALRRVVKIESSARAHEKMNRHRSAYTATDRELKSLMMK